ncbi:hypothetical protein Q7P37_011187 [Cladosporium fusiforme]
MMVKIQWLSLAIAITSLSTAVHGCESCEHPERNVILTRNVRRMQPESLNATSGPRGPLQWGQLNFLHTTDTHGWLEGHLKEQNYGADWGDYASFVKHMRATAKAYNVDLLLVDSGDLHDGAGLSDATDPNGLESNRLFEEIEYDVLTPGNHELYEAEITYEHFYNFSKRYGDRYVSSNVQVLNPATSEFEYLGVTHRYFTTNHGLRIMAFGVLFNFTGNSNASKVIPASEMVNQTWFQDVLHCDDPVDLYLVIGHNPARPTEPTSTFATVHEAIRAVKPDTPIQIFGGHNHIRDFAIYDDKSTALGSGRYCETLGWLSMSGVESDAYTGAANPIGVPNPTRRAINSTSDYLDTLSDSANSSSLLYSRRYLDWNRVTFEHHAAGSQIKTFDTPKGRNITEDIYDIRHDLNLTGLYGCAPQTWCVSCAPFLSNGSIYSLLQQALSAVVMNETRRDNARVLILNTGSVRFDVPKGPFTYDDSFIVSPFDNAFQYIPEVPYKLAGNILDILNNGSFFAKRSLSAQDFGFYNPSLSAGGDACTDPSMFQYHSKQKRSLGRIVRRQNTDATPGYVTKDDFGNDGDDTVHSAIPSFKNPQYFATNGTFPTDGSLPETVDLVFIDFIQEDVLEVLGILGGSYSDDDVQFYMPPEYTTNSYLPLYAQTAESWQADMPNCPVGLGIGYNDTSS